MRIRPGARSSGVCLGLVVTAMSAAGCAPAPDRARHTVEEYRHDPELRPEELARCSSDPGALGSSADCVNVREADEMESVGSLRDRRLRVPPKK